MQAPLLLIAGACKSIDISCPSRAQQQTRRTPLSIDGTDRQTDGRTLGRYRDPPLRTVVSIRDDAIEWVIFISQRQCFDFHKSAASLRCVPA